MCLSNPLAPLVPSFPIRFREVSILSAFYRTDTDAIEALVPAPLTPVGDVVVIHVYRMGDVEGMGALNECNVMVGAQLDRQGAVVQGGFSVAQFVTSDVALAHGREVHGQPKKLARVTLEARDDLWVGRVERNSIELITVTLPYKTAPSGWEWMRRYFDFTLNINYKAIKHIDGGDAVRELTARRLEDLVLGGCWGGECTVELRPNARAPVWRLPVLEPLDGFFWTTEFTLLGGERLHDYLAQGG
jgi:acetoacetate decarboxylase